MFRKTACVMALWAALIIPAILSSGCSSLSGGKGGFGSQSSHKLTDDAKAIRTVNSGPLALPRELEKQPLPPYIVEPADVLLVQPIDLDSPVRLPGDQPVLPDGTINLGRYGHLLVAGKTVPEIEEMVRAAVLTKTKDAGFISVRLVSRQSKVYYVLGEVNAPGVFQLNGRETVLDALMAAGGVTDRASVDNIILSRPSKPDECRTVLPVCYRNIVQLGDTTTNFQIAPGDRIYVPGKRFLESVFGGKCDKSNCGGFHAPCPQPPYPGSGGCVMPESEHLPNVVETLPFRATSRTKGK